LPPSSYQSVASFRAVIAASGRRAILSLQLAACECCVLCVGPTTKVWPLSALEMACGSYFLCHSKFDHFCPLQLASHSTTSRVPDVRFLALACSRCMFVGLCCPVLLGCEQTIRRPSSVLLYGGGPTDWQPNSSAPNTRRASMVEVDLRTTHLKQPDDSGLSAATFAQL